MSKFKPKKLYKILRDLEPIQCTRQTQNMCQMSYEGPNITKYFYKMFKVVNFCFYFQDEYHVMKNEMMNYISNYCGWISKWIIQIK